MRFLWFLQVFFLLLQHFFADAAIYFFYGGTLLVFKAFSCLFTINFCLCRILLTPQEPLLPFSEIFVTFLKQLCLFNIFLLFWFFFEFLAIFCCFLEYLLLVFFLFCFVALWLLQISFSYHLLIPNQPPRNFSLSSSTGPTYILMIIFNL